MSEVIEVESVSCPESQVIYTIYVWYPDSGWCLEDSCHNLPAAELNAKEWAAHSDKCRVAIGKITLPGLPGLQ